MALSFVSCLIFQHSFVGCHLYHGKAGIDDNDLTRKVENLAKYLVKGHTCKITITSNRKNLRRDKEAVVTTLNRVREIVGDRAVEPRALRGNEQGTHAVITFQPNPKARSKK